MERRRLLDPIEHGFSFNHNFINEKWSRSEEIDQAVEDVYNAIEQKMQQIKPQDLDKYTELYLGTCKCNIFDIDVWINFAAYNSINDDYTRKAIETRDVVNSFDEDRNIIFVTIYMSNGNVYDPLSTKNITHEVEHLFQSVMSKKDGKVYHNMATDEYNYAREIMDKVSDDDETKFMIAWLFYISNTHEQDALINEYYEDLKYRNQFIFDKDSQTHWILSRYKIFVTWLKNLNNEELEQMLLPYRKFGYNRNVFLKMVQNGCKRFERKMKNIEKHFQDRTRKLNETKINYYGKHIGSFRKFKLPH